MLTQTLEYQDGDQRCIGYLAWPDTSTPTPIPAILVAPDWTGRNSFACQKVDQLAELGYVGLAMDIYGNAQLGQTNEEKARLMKPFVEDRAHLQKRLLAAFETIKAQPDVDATRIGAIGFCFGGLCALDLARSGTNLKGIVSFHGLLHAPTGLKKEPIKAKILAHHGHDDPMVPPEQLAAFQQEMTDAGVDWQVHVYGHALHAFTNPQAHDRAFGTVYNAIAAQRSWLAMQQFFAEVFT